MILYVIDTKLTSHCVKVLFLNTYKALLCQELIAVKQNDKPNIIFILTDDQGFSDVSWRNKQVRTPNLDALSFGFKSFFIGN